MKRSYQRYLRPFMMSIGLFVACADPVPPATDVESVTAAGGTTVIPDNGTGGTRATHRSSAPGGTQAIFVPGLDSSKNQGSLPKASETEDGTLLISAEKAAQALEAPEATCQGWSVEAEAESSVILFLVDVSGSMLESTPSTGGRSKWEVTRAALKVAIAGLPSSVGIGISFFPNMEIVSETKHARSIEACVDASRDVPLAAATPDQRDAVSSALDGIEPFQKAATPTHDALELALGQLNTASMAGKKYLVLITDGQPTQSQGCLGTGIMCAPSPVEPILATISNANSGSQISTFVVGSPGSERNYCTDADVRGWLSRAARAGNTASSACSDDGTSYCHFDLSASEDFGIALTSALSEISRSIISCKYKVPPPTNGNELDPDRVNMIFLDGSGQYYLLLPNSSGVCDRGWSFTDPTKTTVEICGDTCAALQDQPNARLSILFGCKMGESLLL